jgi:hypothetical protein
MEGCFGHDADNLKPFAVSVFTIPSSAELAETVAQADY